MTKLCVASEINNIVSDALWPVLHSTSFNNSFHSHSFMRIIFNVLCIFHKDGNIRFANC